MAAATVNEHLPTPLDATSEQPPLFDGTTRLYTNYACPFAQRVWITRNYKGLHDKIKLVPIDLQNRPAWYKEKVYHENRRSLIPLINKTIHKSFKGDTVKEAGPDFDHLENALHKFDDGPFFLGHEFSLVDIGCIPFIERFQILFSALWNYDITSGRPKLARWIEELNKIDAYKPTKADPKVVIELYKARFQVLTI
ncbi:glutathione s-transferase l3 [Quercus suber]|uniref:Glutathione s-transferase l3 n=1 Tax=Quercus suber TaxID=58331 RepID=A0AAW0M8A5_QUESU